MPTDRGCSCERNRRSRATGVAGVRDHGRGDCRTAVPRLRPRSPPAAAPNWPAGDIRWLLVHAPAERNRTRKSRLRRPHAQSRPSAAIYGDSPSSKSYLTNLGYLGGAGIAWRAESPRYDVGSACFQFGAAAQAATWVADVQRSLGAGPVESSATLPEVPGWDVVRHHARRRRRLPQSRTRYSNRAPSASHMTFWCYPSVMPAVVTAIAAHQYARLPAA